MKTDPVLKLVLGAIAVGLLWLCSLVAQFREDLSSKGTLDSFNRASESIKEIQVKISGIFKDGDRGRR